LDDRTLVQTDKAELPAEVLLGGKPQCYQDADLLRTDGPAADGGDQEKVGDEEVVRQHDHRDQTTPDELCEPYGVHKGHLQGVAKDARCASGFFSLILRGGTTLDFRQVFFRLKPNIDKGYTNFLFILVGQQCVRINTEERFPNKIWYIHKIFI
jgi:hypothetical protein